MEEEKRKVAHYSIINYYLENSRTDCVRLNEVMFSTRVRNGPYMSLMNVFCKTTNAREIKNLQ